MEPSFPHYLLSKQTVDDRALNRTVYAALQAALPDRPLRVLEVGAGIASMPVRLLRWGLFHRGEYVAVDEMPENLDFARSWLPQQAAGLGLRAAWQADGGLRLSGRGRDLRLELRAGDLFEYLQSGPAPFDLLIAHAVLDLLPLPDSLPRLFAGLKPGGLAWLTVNFDGVTIFEPVLDPHLDERIERLYHRTMDERPGGGDSRTGRHLFGHLRSAGVRLLAAGASDWVVYPVDGAYPAEEAYFLNFILSFFESSLAGHPGLDSSELAGWLAARQAQVERAELVFIAHQMDFLMRV